MTKGATTGDDKDDDDSGLTNGEIVGISMHFSLFPPDIDFFWFCCFLLLLINMVTLPVAGLLFGALFLAAICIVIGVKLLKKKR